MTHNDWEDPDLITDDTAEDSQETALPEETPQLVFGSTDEFLRDYLRTTYRRPINGSSRIWKARWWEYDEAITRLEALWRAWEHLRLDPATGMSVWWRDHADHHMPVLMSPDGPFHGEDNYEQVNRTQRNGDPLPYEAPPVGLFPDVRTGEIIAG